jgi:crotonobetainyl-CoA:carnitine CoA-transferase CaiB-like acyl-CoA transferase
VLATRSAEEWLELLTVAAVPCAPVLTRTETLTHPQILANGIVVESDHPQAGRIRQARPAARFSATAAVPQHPAPPLGADTAAVLEEAGLTAAEIAALMEKAA